MRVVICGGGVIGACTAYFLARRGVEVIVVECTARGECRLRQGRRLPRARLVRRLAAGCTGAAQLRPCMPNSRASSRAIGAIGR